VTPSRRGLWAAAAILLAVVAGLGGALVSRKMAVQPAGAAIAAQGTPTVTVFAEPSEATITVDGRTTSSGVPVDVTTDHPVEVRLDAQSYAPYVVRLEPERLQGSVQVHVQMRPEPQARRERNR
jgi:hypothetical protein